MISEKHHKSGEFPVGMTAKDDIEFLFTANLGYLPQSLRQIASSEKSNRMLFAIRTVLAKAEASDCLLFDKIDTGIGDQAALTVAKYLQQLGHFKQVLCVTHFSVISAYADVQICLKCIKYKVLKIKGEERCQS